MSYAQFPILPGLGWSVHKRPSFSTRIAPHVSGRELRAANMATPIWEFELTYEVLRAGAEAELQTLLGFFLARQGQFDAFLFSDRTDNYALGQPLGIGDGVSTSFTFLHTLGGFTEPVGHVAGVDAVRVGGIAKSYGPDWGLAEPNILNFAGAPANGQPITADFSFWYLVRFAEDLHDYENFMDRLWTLKSCKLRSVKP